MLILALCLYFENQEILRYAQDDIPNPCHPEQSEEPPNSWDCSLIYELLRYAQDDIPNPCHSEQSEGPPNSCVVAKREFISFLQSSHYE